jgi:transcription factor E2F3
MSERRSLVTVTQGFLRILAEADGGEVDLVFAEHILKTTKRRLYDVVNVLAGVGLIVRSGKSRVRCTSNAPGVQPPQSSELLNRELELDAMLAQVDADLIELSNSGLFQKCGWIDATDASKCVSDNEVAFYSLKGLRQCAS